MDQSLRLGKICMCVGWHPQFDDHGCYQGGSQRGDAQFTSRSIRHTSSQGETRMPEQEAATSVVDLVTIIAELEHLPIKFDGLIKHRVCATP